MPKDNPTAGQRLHVATYATDKRKGGYNVRIKGPYADRFVGREVPVTTKDGSEHTEKLTRLLWTGPDTDPETKRPTGLIAALYAFEPRPREEQAELDF